MTAHPRRPMRRAEGTCSRAVHHEHDTFDKARRAAQTNHCHALRRWSLCLLHQIQRTDLWAMPVAEVDHQQLVDQLCAAAAHALVVRQRERIPIGPRLHIGSSISLEAVAARSAPAVPPRQADARRLDSIWLD
jgi:hypothetical protein